MPYEINSNFFITSNSLSIFKFFNLNGDFQIVNVSIMPFTAILSKPCLNPGQDILSGCNVF